MTTPAPISDTLDNTIAHWERVIANEGGASFQMLDTLNFLRQLLALRRAKPAEGGGVKRYELWMRSVLPADYPQFAVNASDYDALSTQLAAVREELRVMREAKEWRPIETAPRDGTIIIGWSAGWESPTAIQWSEGYEWRDELGDTRYEIGDWDWNGTIQCPPSHDPTHWRPLPAPPDSSGGK